MKFKAGRDLAGLLDQAVVSAGSLLVTSIFLRAAGFEEFGILSLVWLALMFTTSIQHAGLVAPAYALLPKMQGDEARDFRGWLLLVQVGFMGLLLVVLLGSWFAPGFSLIPRAAGLLPSLAFLGARQALGFFRLLLFAQEDGPRRALPIDFLHALLSISVLLYLSWIDNLDAASGLMGLALASALAACIAAPSFFRLGCRLCLPDSGILQRHIALSKWLVGKALAQWFTANSFLTALGTIQGASALGGVRAAQTLIGVAGVVIQSFENLIPARAARAFDAGGGPELRAFLLGSLPRWFGYLSLYLVPVLLFPNFSLWLLTGEEQSGLLEPLYYFGTGSLIALLIMFLQASLRAVERARALFLAQLAAGAIGVVAAVPVTNAFGIQGCMWGIIAQQLIVLALLIKPAMRHLHEAPGSQN